MNGGRVQALISLSGLVMIFFQMGCTTVAKRAYYEVRGAKVSVMPAETVAERNEIIRRIEPYKSFTFRPATTTLGDHLCPPRVLASFDNTAAHVHTNEKFIEGFTEHYPGGEPTLTITTDVQMVEAKGLLSTAMLFARVKFVDGERMVLDTLVMTESKGFREAGREKLAEETAEGIGRFLIHAKTGEKDLDDMLP